MNRWKGVVVSIVVCGVAWAGQEFQIAGGNSNQYRPAISRTLVVWKEVSDTDWLWHVKGADIRDPLHPQPFTVSVDPYGDSSNPAISDTNVVFEYDSKVFEESTIMVADISHLDKPIVWPLATTARGRSNYPVVCKDIVAWQDYMDPDWDIVAVRVSGGSAHRLLLPMTSSANEQFVALDGTVLLWEYSSPEKAVTTIMDCNVSDPNVVARPLSSTEGNHWCPAISGRWAACATDQGIEIDTLTAPAISRKITGVLKEPLTQPSICRNVVVWAQNEGDQYDVYGYNLAQARQFRITDQPADQVQPQISFSPELGAYLVVWQDQRNGNWNIYGKVLDVNDTSGCATPVPGDTNGDCKVDALDLTEVQSRIGQVNGVPAQ